VESRNNALKQSERSFKGQDITVLHSKFSIEPPKDPLVPEDQVKEVPLPSSQNKPDSESKKPKPVVPATTTSFKPRGVMKSRINL
jgi:hypothetical protein